MSNHKTSENALSNHKTQDYIMSNHTIKDHAPSAFSNHAHPKLHPPLHSDHRLDWTVDGTLRWSPAHSRLPERDEERTSDYTVDMRLQNPDSQPSRVLESPGATAAGGRLLRSRGGGGGLRPVREGSVDSVQMLDNLNVGAELEEWPLHRDLTLSPPLKSQPITLEQDGEQLTLKTNSVSVKPLGGLDEKGMDGKGQVCGRPWLRK